MLEAYKDAANKKLLKMINSDKKVAKKFNLPCGTTTKAMLRDYIRDNKLTWHELNDCVTSQLVPTDINRTFLHLGGIGEINSGAFKSDGFMSK